jgi:hypothetical protein
MADFADLAVQLEMAGVAHEMITDGGAPHAFTVFGSDRYRKDADEKSWKRFTEFLAETLDGVAKTHQLLRCCNCSRCFDVRMYASLLDNRAPCIWRFLLSHRH